MLLSFIYLIAVPILCLCLCSLEETKSRLVLKICNVPGSDSHPFPINYSNTPVNINTSILRMWTQETWDLSRWCLSRESAVCLLGPHQLLAKQASKSQAFVAHSWENPPGGSQVVGGFRPPLPSALGFCCSLGPWSTQRVAAIHTKSSLFIILESHLSLYGPTLKKAEHRRIDAFKLWCWRRLLRAPWTARRSN